MALKDVLALPMKSFWFLSGSVNRILAEEQRDHLELLCASQHPENAVSIREHLSLVVGEPIKFTTEAKIAANSKADPGGIDELRNLA